MNISTNNTVGTDTLQGHIVLLDKELHDAASGPSGLEGYARWKAAFMNGFSLGITK